MMIWLLSIGFIPDFSSVFSDNQQPQTDQDNAFSRFHRNCAKQHRIMENRVPLFPRKVSMQMQDIVLQLQPRRALGVHFFNQLFDKINVARVIANAVIENNWRGRILAIKQPVMHI